MQALSEPGLNPDGTPAAFLLPGSDTLSGAMENVSPDALVTYGISSQPVKLDAARKVDVLKGACILSRCPGTGRSVAGGIFHVFRRG
jgi:hypothetical protein